MDILGFLKPFVRRTEQALIKNAPHLLMGFGTGCSISALIFAAKAAPDANRALMEKRHEKACEEQKRTGEDVPLCKLTVLEWIQTAGKYYGPAAAMEMLALVCFWAAHGIDIRRQAVLSGLCATAEQALQEYQRKVQQMLGEKQERDIRDNMAQDTVDKTPLPANTTYYLDGSTERWFIFKDQRFRSTYLKIKDAQNLANQEMIQHMYISEAEVMWLLDPSRQYLKPDHDSGQVGWNVDNLMEFDIGWGTDENHEPVGVITIYDRDGCRYYPKPNFSANL